MALAHLLMLRQPTLILHNFLTLRFQLVQRTSSLWAIF